jgi:hypothetical protein
LANLVTNVRIVLRHLQNRESSERAPRALDNAQRVRSCGIDALAFVARCWNEASKVCLRTSIGLVSSRFQTGSYAATRILKIVEQRLAHEIGLSARNSEKSITETGRHLANSRKSPAYFCSSDIAHRDRTGWLGIRDKPIAPSSPWQNGFAESDRIDPRRVRRPM